MTVQRLFGGVFPLAKVGVEPVPPPWSGSVRFPHSLSFTNARSALRYLSQHLQSPHVWLPSYLCPVMAQCFASDQIHLYPVSSHLNIDDLEWVQQVQPADLVVLIAYFGFLLDTGLPQMLKERQALLLLDAAQALFCLDAPTLLVDFILMSPRKWLGTPDGGILLSRQALSQPSWQSPPSDWWQLAYQTVQGRYDFEQGQCDQESWFKAFQQAEAIQPMGDFPISEVSQQLLHTAFDWSTMAQQRRQNYLTLLADLAPWALFQELLGHCVPFGFPLRLLGRNNIQNALFQKNIYPPIHWNLADVVPAAFAESHQLSHEILTLPCDQRYTTADMQYLAHTVRELLDA